LEKHFVIYEAETEFLSLVFRLTSAFKRFNAEYLLSSLHPKHIGWHIKSKDDGTINKQILRTIPDFSLTSLLSVLYLEFWVLCSISPCYTDGLQMWSVVADRLNKQPQTADKVVVLQHWGCVEANNLFP
jgi:hypothetical protein